MGAKSGEFQREENRHTYKANGTVQGSPRVVVLGDLGC